MTILSELVTKHEDIFGYITYVFECLDEEIRKQTKYIMCTRLPRWEHYDVQIGEIGFLNFIEVRAGIDTWFNGDKQIPYRYNNIYFIKFVPYKEKQEHKFTV